MSMCRWMQKLLYVWSCRLDAASMFTALSESLNILCWCLICLCLGVYLATTNWWCACDYLITLLSLSAMLRSRPVTLAFYQHPSLVSSPWFFTSSYMWLMNWIDSSRMVGRAWVSVCLPGFFFPAVCRYFSLQLISLLIQVMYMFTLHTYVHTLCAHTLWIECFVCNCMCNYDSVVCLCTSFSLRGVFHHLALKRMKHAHAFSAAYTHCHPHKYAAYTPCDTHTYTQANTNTVPTLHTSCPWAVVMGRKITKS